MSIHTKSMEPLYKFYSRRLERPKKLKSCIVMEGDNTKAEPSRLLLLNSLISLSSVLRQNLFSPFCGGSQVYQTDFAVRVIIWLHTLDVDFFSKRYDALVSHWDKCLALGEVMALLKSSIHVYVCVLKRTVV